MLCEIHNKDCKIIMMRNDFGQIDFVRKQAINMGYLRHPSWSKLFPSYLTEVANWTMSDKGNYLREQ